MRSLVGNMLREIGFEILEAGNGRQAMERLRHMDPPDLMLVDCNMPEMDGFEFVGGLRSDPSYRDVWVMMVTTETEHDRVAQALELGVDEYLMKPFTREAMYDKLRLGGFEAPVVVPAPPEHSEHFGFARVACANSSSPMVRKSMDLPDG